MKDFFELRENKDKFIVKYSMSKKGPIRQMPFHLLAYAKKFLADKEKEGYKGIISKGGKPVKESVELDEAVSKVKTTMPDKVASSATRFGLKAKSQGGSVSISGPKGKLNDFLRAIIGRSSYGDASELDEANESVEMNEQFVVKYAKNKRGPIYQTKFKTQPEAEKFLAQKKKEGMNGIVSKAGKPVSMQKMADLQKESVELSEAPDLMKMSKELLKHKDKGVDYEKAAAYVRAIHNNSAVSVQDKAMKGLLDLLKNMDLTDRTTITKILKDNGFKTKGGRLMREEVEFLDENYRTLAMHGMGTESKGEARVGLELDYYDSTGSKRMGKITKMTRSGYVVKDEKDGKSRTFAFHDRAKAKELLAKHGKGKYKE